MSHSWYDYSGGKNAGPAPLRRPDQPATTPARSRRSSSSTSSESYSWLKSPRWKGKVMEVGPLARVLMLYAKGHEPTRELAKLCAEEARSAAVGDVLDHGTHGGAHAREQDRRRSDAELVRQSCSPTSRPAISRSTIRSNGIRPPGRRRRAASASWKRRAARSHTGSSSRTGRSTITRRWCPRPGTRARATRHGQPGPYEAALMDRHTLYDPKQPLEIQRTIHSFDPCIACAVHVVERRGRRAHAAAGPLEVRP